MVSPLITAIIADDEAHARERLRELLGRFNIFSIIGEASDGTEALELIITKKPEVAFLDITMPGISVFQSLPSLQNPPLVVFQTAYSEHAAHAFDINALDYILKPIRFERLEKTVVKIIEKRGAGASDSMASHEGASPALAADHIAVTVAGKTKLITTGDIIKISVEGGFCCLYAHGEKIMSDKYLNYFEEKLKGNPFFRTSRTDIVNLHRIAMIQKEDQGMFTIVMEDGSKIEVSRRKAQELRKVIDF
jgi:two-component system LytT family response regulator